VDDQTARRLIWLAIGALALMLIFSR